MVVLRHRVFPSTSDLLPQPNLKNFCRSYMFDTFRSSFFMGLSAGVNILLLHLPNCLRGDRDVEGFQYCCCGCGGGPAFFVQYQGSSKINSQRFARFKPPLTLLMCSTSSSGDIRSTGSHGVSHKFAHTPWFYHSLISFVTWPQWAFLVLATSPTVLYLPFRKSSAARVFLFLSGDAAWIRVTGEARWHTCAGTEMGRK